MRAITAHHSDLNDLYAELTESLAGSCHFSSASVAMYTSDASNYRQVPLGIVYPKNVNDIKIATALCKDHGVPLLMRGGGTSQNGQCVNNAVIIDCSKHLNKVLDIDVQNRTALIEPGIVCDALKHQAEQHGLTFGPDPATHSRCTLGGMIGNNSCGPHSMLSGKTVENVLELEILTSDGHSFWVGPTTDAELEQIISKGDRQSEIYAALKSLVDKHANDIREKFPNIKRRVSGYNLDQLLPENGFNVARALVGTEGTCVSVLQAKVQLIELPKYVRLVVLGFNDIFNAGDAVPCIMPFKPIAMEGLDWNIVGGLNDRNLRQKEVALLPEGRAWLLVELSAANESELEKNVSAFAQAMQQEPLIASVLEVTSQADEKALWSIREQGASATSLALNPGDTDPIVGWEDTAVDPMRLGDYLRALYELVDRYGYKTSLYGHFGDGCIHARMTFDTRTEAGVAKWRRFSKEIADLVVAYGGSLSGEHGDGQAKAEFLPAMFGDKLVGAFQSFKSIWDPDGRMNPRKVVNPYRMDENLRYGPDYTTPEITSALNFIDDVGGMGRASERCIGMGKCRAATGSMCPSYQATGEERYSTRGRAHLLHELMRGELISDGWDNTEIADSLEHCLSCKACKSSCPTKVDIAAYKSEFMQRHYSGIRRRPLTHTVFGKIGNWLPIASRYSWLANWFTKGVFADVARKVLSLDKTAPLPTLSNESFAQWAQVQSTIADENFYWHGEQQGKPVVLWADSVNCHISPHVLKTAVSVLTRLGFRVAIAKAHFCCGRPLYEYGYLDTARKQTQSILQHFHPYLPDNAAVIVLEPSCLSVFKDELLKMHPDDANATDLAIRCVSLIGFLISENIRPKTNLDQAILHTHCHDKSADTPNLEQEWLKGCFSKIIEPEESCCGMAGTFGLSKKTSGIAQTLYSRKLGPAIAASAKDTTIVANGYSCRSQINQHSSRTACHTVEIINQCV